MRRIYIIIAATILLFGCASYDLPTVESSKRTIEAVKPELAANELFIKARRLRAPTDKNLALVLKKSAVNKLLQKLTERTDADLKIFFPTTKPLVKKEKSVFGIKYDNYINVEDGFLTVDAEKIEIVGSGDNALKIAIKLKGKGALSITGSNAGVKASVKSDVTATADEIVSFGVKYLEGGNIALVPLSGKLNLTIDFDIFLLNWDIPWSETIELDAEEILPEISLPLAISTRLYLPMPNYYDKGGGFVDMPFEANFTRKNVVLTGEKIELYSDFELKEK